MEVIELNNGNFKVTSEFGVIDTRNGNWYSEAVVSENNLQFIVASTEDHKIA